MELEKQKLLQLLKAGDWKAMQARIDNMRSSGIDLGTEVIASRGVGLSIFSVHYRVVDTETIGSSSSAAIGSVPNSEMTESDCGSEPVRDNPSAFPKARARVPVGAYSL